MNNLPMDQTGNNFNNTNTIFPTPQNNTFEFYLPLPNDTQIGQQSVGYQQNTIPQQSFDTMIIQPNFQEYSDNNAYDVSSSIPQDAIPQQSFNTMDIQPAFQEYSDNNAYNTSPISSNSPEDNSS
ncbi:uncharacterized protein OCT59_026914 [Rhizophagus irregularis]|uniref:Uncharacterized protein n=2 Tax=Rhizophagus irregularis TaxID=588596 RepID=A0A015NK06_RHIIW|nr:hypothetical protein GLOIN_2v1775515 [Rhizophagus irregularis DAOM 181602=DAOM 197198]EXX79763.1 hypothetical protein RirG_002460 [Rhizophagus irregularis DAOM 197198w]UZO06600.1 hypothetical protein OCT59_026914 [Rhizophagus irregularis]POG70780.1 hypothetical protein GLOIN_2v1775515 [Rhizophagus irregularis DAOM 181602=DAOM 197198]CAG8576816.1 8809_t:CDS:2 [Rhizophagus irregularis]GBC22712.2 hypothetical protein GLOIN_2v1775515 [Rhizophagus irregularis DAOM 181602=DAOM 197198]|eukprot:XP_025177646.1 hypothetical protein GLOIN_2v1775515 [Rhizophagus irregularis DAOM 181602=DAOM 197198]